MKLVTKMVTLCSLIVFLATVIPQAAQARMNYGTSYYSGPYFKKLQGPQKKAVKPKVGHHTRYPLGHRRYYYQRHYYHASPYHYYGGHYQYHLGIRFRGGSIRLHYPE
jgi:hypothetical protein